MIHITLSALFWIHLHSFALICIHLHSYAILCSHLNSSTFFCILRHLSEFTCVHLCVSRNSGKIICIHPYSIELICLCLHLSSIWNMFVFFVNFLSWDIYQKKCKNSFIYCKLSHDFFYTRNVSIPMGAQIHFPRNWISFEYPVLKKKARQTQ